MRKIYIPLLAVLLVTFTVWISYHKTHSNKIKSRLHSPQLIMDDEEDEKEEGEDGIFYAQQLDFELTKDVKLGYVPTTRLIQAFEDMKMQRRMMRGEKGINMLPWTERGPDRDVVGPYNGNTRAGNDVTSGRMRAIWVDLADPTNHTVWIGGIDGGVWKTNDITAKPAVWTSINDFLGNLAVGSICQDPTNHDIMYFGTGEKTINIDAVRGGGVWKSVDHGSTWDLLPSTKKYYNVSKILCDKSGNVYVSTIGSGYGVLRSTDGGSNWLNISPIGASALIPEMELSSTGRLHIISGYRIPNGGGSFFTDNPATVISSGWIAPTTAIPGVSYNTELAVAGNTLYAMPSNSAYQTPQIYKSVDGGANWLPTLTSPPVNKTNNTLSNGQGWYCLALAVDTANTNRVIAGGLNCWRTSDGGATWNQVSSWVGSSLTYVHADQQIAVWNGDQVLMGSDGGIFISSDAGQTFSDRNVGLRLKQFYSVAMHPTSTNYFLAGAQDNGVHQLTKPGLSSSVEVSGGDGAFVHIDQDQPQYQFGSTPYNNYRRSLDGGNSWSTISFSNKGSFINPTDYDNVNNKLYAAGNVDTFYRWENPQTGSTYTPIYIPAFDGVVRSVTVSPYTNNRVYFGISNGKIFRVNNATASTPTAIPISTGLPATNVSHIEIGTSDDYLMSTYSNYGSAGHVWLSTNGGTSWTNVSGNLPDIPVRWSIFFPEDNTKAMVATELGVFETNDLNGSSTVWTQNPTFPLVRTDMLKYRKSDGTVVAATHGRGLWTTVIPRTIPYIRFSQGFGTATEETSGTENCKKFTDYAIPINIDFAPTGTGTVTIAVNSGTAEEGIDFDVTTNGNFSSPSHTLTFENGSTSSKNFTIRVYDNGYLDDPRDLEITATVTGSTDAVIAPSGAKYGFTIYDNDPLPQSSSVSGGAITIGTSDYYLNDSTDGPPFDAKLVSKRTTMNYKASELIGAGFSRGTITSISFLIEKYSTRPYKNLKINMGTTDQPYIDVNDVVVPFVTTTVKSLSSYAVIDGWNKFDLDVPFSWNGTDNVIVEVCYDNTTASPTDFADRIIGYSDGGSNIQANMIWKDNITCATNYVDADGYGEGYKPQLKMEVLAGGNLIATSGSGNLYLNGRGTNYFYTDNNVIGYVGNMTAVNGCTNVTIVESGNEWQPFSGGLRSKKIIEIVPDNNSGSYRVGLYFTADELDRKDPTTLKLAKTTAASLADANSSNTVIVNTTALTYGSGRLFRGSFTGFSKFFLVDASVTLPVTLVSFDGTLQGNTVKLFWKTSTEINASYFEVQKSSDGTHYLPIGKVSAKGNSNTETSYGLTDQNAGEINYYRLNMVDKDGRSSLSNIVLIKNPNASQKITVLNNPFHDRISLRFAKIPKSIVLVELTSMNGEKMYQKEMAPSSQINLVFDKTRLANGTYVLRAKVDGIFYTYKVLKQ